MKVVWNNVEIMEGNWYNNNETRHNSMKKTYLMEPMKRLEQLDDYDYILYKLLFHGAATFSKEKPASLITLKNTNKRLNALGLWDKYKDQIGKTTRTSYYEMKRDENHVVILFFHKRLLEVIIENSENIEFLERFGYDSKMNLIEALQHLSSRFVDKCPHEVGLFLGYHLEDVVEYIKETDGTGIVVGYWKVYTKADEAIRKFKRYDQARAKVTEGILSGLSPMKTALILVS